MTSSTKLGSDICYHYANTELKPLEHKAQPLKRVGFICIQPS